MAITGLTSDRSLARPIADLPAPAERPLLVNKEAHYTGDNPLRKAAPPSCVGRFIGPPCCPCQASNQRKLHLLFCPVRMPFRGGKMVVFRPARFCPCSGGGVKLVPHFQLTKVDRAGPAGISRVLPLPPARAITRSGRGWVAGCGTVAHASRAKRQRTAPLKFGQRRLQAGTGTGISGVSARRAEREFRVCLIARAIAPTTIRISRLSIPGGCCRPLNR